MKKYQDEIDQLAICRVDAAILDLDGIEEFLDAHVQSTDADLVATVLLIVGAIHYLIVLGRLKTDFSGIEIDTDAGWEHIDQIISTIFERTFEASG